jgi:hypothetical protein
MKFTMIAALSIATAATALPFAAIAYADGTPVNLPVTDDVRAQLVQAGAVLTRQPAGQYTGLQPGKTYYAYDPDNDTYWAAAALSGPKTFQAAVMLQDANSYMIFHKQSQGGPWVAIGDGFGAISSGEEPCPLPPKIHDLWQWPPGACYPPPSNN